MDRLIEIVEKVPRLRNDVKETIQEAQKKLEDSFGVQKSTQFAKGELVWYYDKAKAVRHDTKLENKWKGPYEISQVLDKGAYKLKIDGKELKTTVNGNLLKKYHSRSNWEPIVMIT